MAETTGTTTGGTTTGGTTTGGTTTGGTSDNEGAGNTASNVGLTSTIDTYEEALSKSENISTVTCCFRETGQTFKATCGNGTSCAAKCTAQEAELCPSGNCTDDPRDWEISFTGTGSGGSSPSTLASSDLKWCNPSCRVIANPVCCYNPLCFDKRPDSCKWFNFLTGRFQQSFPTSKPEYLCQVNLVRCQELFPMAVGLARCRKRPSRAPPSSTERPKHIKV